MKSPTALGRFLFRSYLEEGEEIELIIHKHVFTLLKPLIITGVVFGLIPSGIWYLAPKLALISLIMLVYGAWRLFYQSVSWYFNAVLITNLNLVDLKWEGFFNRSATRIEYNQIESFSYAIAGFLNTVFIQGDIVVAKNSGTEVIFASLFRPKKKTQILTKLQDEFMTNHHTQQGEAVKSLLTQVLQEHIAEHGIEIE